MSCVPLPVLNSLAMAPFVKIRLAPGTHTCTDNPCPQIRSTSLTLNLLTVIALTRRPPIRCVSHIKLLVLKQGF